MLKRFVLGIAAGALTLSAAAVQAQDTNKDIVDTAVAAGSFQTLAKALQAADLVETLKGKGPYTVFAPTDEAFGKLPAGTLNDLLKPENKQKLQRILSYHVVPGRVSSADVVKLHTAKAPRRAAALAELAAPEGVHVEPYDMPHDEGPGMVLHLQVVPLRRGGGDCA